jgi:uncharacterized delta-60 repeat protein
MRAVHGLWSALIWGVCAVGCGTVPNEDADAAPPVDGGLPDAEPVVDAAPGTVTIAAPAMTFVRVGAAASIAVEISRGDGVTGPVQVTVATAPAGVVVEPLVIPADASTGLLIATVAPDAAFRVETLSLDAAAGDAIGTADAGIEIIGAIGTANPGFGTDGTVTLDTAVASGIVAGIVPQGERVVVVSYDGSRIGGARLDVTGAVDPTFADSGRISIDLSSLGFTEIASAMVAADSQGRIVVGGSARTATTMRPYVLRLDADGDVDAAMTPRILAPTNAALDTVLVAAMPDGGVALMGARGVGESASNWSVRLRENGTVHSSDVPLQIPGESRYVVQADGLVVCREDNRVVRLTPAGQVDTTFGTDGRTALPSMHEPTQWSSVQQIGASFIAMGLDTVWRLGSNGALDTSFGTLGAATISIVGFETGLEAYDLGNGHILVRTMGAPLQGTAYYVGFYELDESGTVVPAAGTDGGIREVLGWLPTFSAAPGRQRLVVAGDSQAAGSSIRVRQYFR